MKKTWKSINQCLNRNPKSNKIVLIKDINEQDHPRPQGLFGHQSQSLISHEGPSEKRLWGREYEQDIKSEGMANAFNEHFINIGTNLAQQIPQTNYPPEYYINSVNKIFTFREKIEEEVLTLLLNMSTNKAIGMDSLSYKLVKLSAPLITHAMTVIFNKSIVSGTFPCE